MNELTARQRLLAAILADIGNFSMRTLPERIAVQKTVYLLQHFGAYLGYDYSWYIYGPYSPSLAKDAFAVWGVSARARASQGAISDDNLRDLVRRLKEFLAGRERDAVWLEALASLHMLARLYPEESPSALIERVLRKAPYFERGQCETAWNHLVASGLLARHA